MSEPATVQLKPLPLMEKRALGGPVPARLLAAYFGIAVVGWMAAGVALIVAAPDLAAGSPLSPAPLLAVHLAALAALPFAVAGASFHLLPVMLRNDLISTRALWLALVLLAGGPAIAAGLERWSPALVWAGVAGVTAGLAIVLVAIGALLVRAPRDRILIASRAGIALSLLHVVVALALGTAVFHRPDDHWILVHLHVALLGWIALLVVTVGRNLAPMLALAPTAPRRSWPLHELVLTAGLWLLLAGLASSTRAATIVGGVVVIAAIAGFGVFLIRVVRERRGPIDAPLGNLLAGTAFLAQAAVVGLVAAAGGGGIRMVEAYVVFLLIGWAGGVVLGHVPKLLSLSLWVWWPQGPRPKQAELYPRRIALAATLLFAVGVEVLALSVIAGTSLPARVGAALVCASAVCTAAATAETWRRRAR